MNFKICKQLYLCLLPCRLYVFWFFLMQTILDCTVHCYSCPIRESWVLDVKPRSSLWVLDKSLHSSLSFHNSSLDMSFPLWFYLSSCILTCLHFILLHLVTKFKCAMHGYFALFLGMDFGLKIVRFNVLKNPFDFDLLESMWPN